MRWLGTVVRWVFPSRHMAMRNWDRLGSISGLFEVGAYEDNSSAESIRKTVSGLQFCTDTSIISRIVIPSAAPSLLRH